jgi:hypothetical protein
VPHPAELLSHLRAVEAILTPPTDEDEGDVVAAEPGWGDDAGPDEPQAPVFRAMQQQVIERLLRMVDEQAAAEALPGGTSGAPDPWEQRRRERQEHWDREEQERRQQREEQARRIDASFGISGDRPDRREHDLAAGGEAGRAPPDQA